MLLACTVFTYLVSVNPNLEMVGVIIVPQKTRFPGPLGVPGMCSLPAGEKIALLPNPKLKEEKTHATKAGRD